MGELADEEDLERVRAGIVERYKCGPEGPIEPWEDASFIIYQVTDRYGFLHKNPLPQYEKDEKILEIERERTKKWIKMFSNWQGYFSVERPNEKLKRRVFKGIPDSIRGEAWKKMLCVDKFDRTGIYEQFRNFSHRNSPDVRQIDLDVNRTYRDHIMFRDRFSVKQQALFNILAAYSVYNTDVGYCQGMSGIAALLLMYMNEEDAFWALSELLTDRKHAMHGLFVPGFPKLLRLQNHHDKIFKKLIPKMFKHFEKEGVHNSLYTLKWFMQVFLDRLPFSLVLRIYDIFILEGDYVLTVTAYHILKIFKRQLIKMDLESLAPFLQEGIPNYVFVDDELIESLQESMQELRKHKLDIAPTPGLNEIPSKPPGTLPDRNSFITASKRARMLKDKSLKMEIPIGKAPSPVPVIRTSKDQKLSSEHLNDINKEESNNDDIIIKKGSKPLPIKQIPSYSEFVEQKLEEKDNTSNHNGNHSLHSRRSTEQIVGKSSFYVHNDTTEQNITRSDDSVNGEKNQANHTSNESYNSGHSEDRTESLTRITNREDKVIINGFGPQSPPHDHDVDPDSEIKEKKIHKRRKGPGTKSKAELKQHAVETVL